MNFGDSKLRYVNTSTPRLVHTNSKQSITASDDYYSLTSEGSSNNDDRNIVQRYQTPPLRMRSADPSRDALQSEATIPTVRPVKHQDPGDDEKPEVPIRNEQHRIPRKPVSSSSSDGTIVRRPVSEIISPPTPGVDDTPYIQFAIDQLTRDEEVAGLRHPGNSSTYPVERIIPDEGLGYYGTRQQGQPLRPQDTRTESPPTENILHSTKPTTETFRHPKLNFVPHSLQFVSLGALIFCCLFMIAGLLFCAIYPYSHLGLWQYDGTGTSRYFVFEYLPTLLASFIIIWLQIIQSAMHRVVPFMILSSGRSIGNSGVLHDMTLFPVTYLIPNLSFFSYQEPLLGLCSIIFWLEIFTLPLQSCLFQTRYYNSENIWRWTAVQPIAWTLFVLYLLLLVALLLLLVRFVPRQTGLKWDPVSLADILSLFHRSNFLSDFARSEMHTSSIRQHTAKHLRLGYWNTSKQANEAFYGIGEENAPVPRFSLEQGKIAPNTGHDLEAQEPMKASTFDTLKDVHDLALRYRWTPWFLRDGMVVAWIVIAIVLMIAFIVVSFVNHAVQRGFLPLLPAPTTTEGFSPADFLYSFIPSLIGMLLFLLWQPVDLYFRALQPFASLAHRDGASAEQSLLLDYTACLPIEVTIKALLNRHYKLAYISFISLLSLTLPVLAGGIFTAQFVVERQDIRVIASMPGYYALVLFVVIYAVSFIVIWPTRKRRLPHDISTLGQLVSFVYQSPLLMETAFAEPTSKTDLVTKLLGTPAGEKETPRYAFKVYVGRDAKEHLGIDRLERFTRFTARGRIDHLRTGSPRHGDLA
ncbi:hypothetical protein HO133_000801 [Letharia lupina]|uniref:Phosphoribosylaminoimidazole-succinocarboxamide synthase n=1 Tax=Letharia lupina TaxID=560253 RepID=A0A8H6FCE6_9LECA|nr:uncharacterized protein HO133_000801 [Letharia lupina]KAF6222753.1 hypothetical protein HO133_000801 [Letharia lupina]